MKKLFIIIGAVVVVGLVVLLFFVASKKPPQETGSGGTTGTLPTASGTLPAYTPPSGTTLTLGTPKGSVTVNNFYTGAKSISVDHTAVLAQETDGYNITYYAPDSSFNILITQTPFDTVRAQAEAAFLQLLGTSKTDACKLNVKVGVPVSVDPSNAGQNLGLSFCSASGAFQAGQ